MTQLDEFEEKVLLGLNLCGINPEKNEINEKNPLGAAVSGGADSVSLLLSLSRILEFFGKKNCLEVITVNHGIREKSQTDGDAAFVEELCKSLGVHCEKIVFESGKVALEAKKRKKGIEEAAREMRYKAFENFITEKNLCALCLAHNQNDQIETILMRFLKGSGIEGLGGIPRARGKIIRPLLEIPREKIEKYLQKNEIDWRTDSTNFDNHYSRNKIRNLLVPFLNENFGESWKNSVLSSGEKNFSDNLFITEIAEEKIEKNLLIKDSKNENSKNGKTAEIDSEFFFNLDFALQRRIIFSALNKIGFGERFPFRLVKEICAWKSSQNRKIAFEKLNIYIEENKLKFEFFEENPPKKAVSSGYQFVFTNENDSFETGNLRFYLEKNDGRIFLCVENENQKSRCEISLPFFVGNAAPGEKIKTADGKFKKIADIFSDWKVSQDDKNLIPVVHSLAGKIEAKAVLGSVCGFKDWKVR